MAQPLTLTQTYLEFFRSEKAGGVLLVLCTAASLLIANSALGPAYLAFWHASFFGLSVEQWINDGLMAVFFLFVGLELERELYNGELSDFRNALLPIVAAAGGIAVPALIYFLINVGTSTQAGVGIPMATDIAFALGVLALLGDRVPAALKIFLTALAVIDDLGAIIVIALFYTSHVSLWYLCGAMAVFALLVVLNQRFRVHVLAPYLLGGAAMWLLMLKSGVHPTIAGVLLAFAIPFSARDDDAASPSHRLEHLLHQPTAFLILPAFALANTAIVIAAGWQHGLFSAGGIGILGGLVLGKPLGIVLFSFVAVSLGLCRLGDLNWKHVIGAGLLGGIGFTMSIFIANLAFAGQAGQINSAKMAIMVASSVAGVLGFLWLRVIPK